MAKKVSVIGFLLVLSLLTVLPAFAGGRGDGPVVYVSSQGLYYDSIITVSPEKGLPMNGPFQKLEMDGPGNEFLLETEFGPGDPSYVGGRWWVDANENNQMDEGDAFFLCPLLGPGRTTELQ
jgi:hypothetical protein